MSIGWQEAPSVLLAGVRLHCWRRLARTRHYMRVLETPRLGGVASTSTWKSQFLWIASNRSSRCALKMMGSLRVYSQLPAQTHADKRLVLLGQRFKSVHSLENAVLLRSLHAPASHTGAYEGTVPSLIRRGSLKSVYPEEFSRGHTRVSLSS